MGAETKLKAGLTGGKEGNPPPGAGLAGATGGKEGKPPAGYRDGKVSRRQRRQAPHRGHGRQSL